MAEQNTMIDPHELMLIRIRNATRAFIGQGAKGGAAKWRVGLEVIGEYVAVQLLLLESEPKARKAAERS